MVEATSPHVATPTGRRPNQLESAADPPDDLPAPIARSNRPGSKRDLHVRENQRQPAAANQQRYPPWYGSEV